MELIECSNLEVIRTRTYGGATGSKICVRYNDDPYMLKRSQDLRGRNLRNVELEFAYDCISEYIGSHFYELCGVPVHDTILGSYNDRICVLCKDISYPGKIVEFREIRNTIMFEDNKQPSSGMSTNMDDIFYIIDKLQGIDHDKVYSRFWLMFVIDSVIGNVDRNNGNWGFIILNDNAFRLAEVYDCGGCLNNKKSDRQLESIISNNRVEEMALSYVFNFMYNGHHVNPFKYMRLNMNNYICKAMNVVLSLDFNSIKNLVLSLKPLITSIRCDYYCEVIKIRLNEIKKIYDSYKTSSMPSLDSLSKLF